ncbi:MAG: hypothetical protein FJ125_07535, partial [Deltaproteobacteria bacterium]|nr:hypothetical protein [Deltaproteobacteria bacterium]
METTHIEGLMPDKPIAFVRQRNDARRSLPTALLACVMLLGSSALPGEAVAAPADGWLYIHKYLNDKQREQLGGIAT